ncbi:MAG: hypothetical protein ABIJ21_07720 [Nanoarchaeota archaeon]
MIKRLSLETIVQIVKDQGPRDVYDAYRTRLDVCDAEYVSRQLHREGLQVEPYDFYCTIGVWQAKRWSGEPYFRHATKTLVQRLASEQGINPFAPEGFRELLSSFSYDTFALHPINGWGTTLRGMLQHAFQHKQSAAVIDLVTHDPDFRKIAKVGLAPYDFPTTSRRAWKDKTGKPTDLARTASKYFLCALGMKYHANPKAPSGMRRLLPHINQHNFNHLPINYWGTTLGGMLQSAYEGSPAAAVIDLVYADPRFAAIKAIGIHPYDFPKAGNRFWRKEGQPTQAARAMSRLLLGQMGKEESVDEHTVVGFSYLLPFIDNKLFRKKKVNYWGTTPGSMLSHAYDYSPSAAVLDLIANDPAFREIEEEGLASYDFKCAANYTWKDRKGKPTPLARALLKKRIVEIADAKMLNYQTRRGFLDLIPHLTMHDVLQHPINAWGTTLFGCVSSAYRGSISKGILDLIQHDEDFSHLEGWFSFGLMNFLPSVRTGYLENVR